jgi:hypothetical protein
MPSRTRTSSRVTIQAPPPSRCEKLYGYNPYPPRRIFAGDRTASYRETDSDEDDEVIYVGQRSKPPTQRVVPTLTLPKIVLGEEDYLAETPLLKEQRAASVKVVAKSECRAIFQTLPYEVCALPTNSSMVPITPFKPLISLHISILLSCYFLGGNAFIGTNNSSCI